MVDYTLYDQTCTMVLYRLLSLSKKDTKIVLGNFNKDDKEHLLVYQLAYSAASIHQIPIAVDLSFSQWLFWKGKLKRTKFSRKATINVPDIVDYLYANCQPENFPDGFGEIYDEYYAGKDK